MMIPRKNLFGNVALCPRAMRADSLDHVGDGFCCESVREFYFRYRRSLETECAVADFAIKMGVHVVQGAVVFAVAYFVFQYAVAVFDGMHDMMFHELAQHPENAGLVHGFHYFRQFRQRYRP